MVWNVKKNWKDGVKRRDNMLSAKEAARMTDEVLEKGFTDELQEIEKCIERKIAKGE